MKYRTLPQTEIELSEIGFGVWTVATNWWGHIEDNDKRLLLENAIELGINFFDTADTYGEGFGEEVLSKYISHKRHDIVIATKFGYDFYDKTPRIGHQERPQKFEPDFIKFACEQSLKRLKTDYIDIYQLHNPRIDTIEQDYVFETLEELKSEGKILHYGSALGPAIGWFEEGEASMLERNVKSLQIIYSILEQDPARSFFPIAEEKEVGLISRVPHASEALTGKYTEPPVFKEGDHRSHRRIEWLQWALQRVEKIDFIHGEELGRTLSQAAILFCLKQPTIVSVLPNITNLQDLNHFVESLECPLFTPQEDDEILDLWNNDFKSQGEQEQNLTEV